VKLSQSRYYVVQTVYDQTVTFRLKELQDATKAIHDAEKKLAAKAASGKAAELLHQAKTLAWSPVINAQQAADAIIAAALQRGAADNASVIVLDLQHKEEGEGGGHA